MAAMSTTLVERNDSDNRREWSLPGHTVAKPALLKQGRTAATTPTGRASDDLRLIYGTVDGEDKPTLVPLMFVLTVTRQANMAASEATTPLAHLRDLVNSDEFTAVVTGQAYVKA